MKFYRIHPEVPGGLGKNTVYNKEVLPWELIDLHAVFEGWLGGDILKISNCYLVTEMLKKEIEIMNLTGIENFKDFDIELSITFKNLYPNRLLPKLYRLIINGEKGIDDFSMISYYELVISEKVLNLFKRFNLSDAEINEFVLA